MSWAASIDCSSPVSPASSTVTTSPRSVRLQAESASSDVTTSRALVAALTGTRSRQRCSSAHRRRAGSRGFPPCSPGHRKHNHPADRTVHCSTHRCNRSQSQDPCRRPHTSCRARGRRNGSQAHCLSSNSSRTPDSRRPRPYYSSSRPCSYTGRCSMCHCNMNRPLCSCRGRRRSHPTNRSRPHSPRPPRLPASRNQRFRLAVQRPGHRPTAGLAR